MFLYHKNKPTGEKGINSNFIEIKNSTVTLFNQLSSTNQASSQAAISKIQAPVRLKLELLVLRKKVNFLPLGIPRCTVFKTFVFLFDEVTPILTIRQFFDLIKLYD